MWSINQRGCTTAQGVLWYCHWHRFLFSRKHGSSVKSVCTGIVYRSGPGRNRSTKLQEVLRGHSRQRQNLREREVSEESLELFLRIVYNDPIAYPYPENKRTV